MVDGHIAGNTSGLIRGDAPLVDGKVGKALYTNGFNQSVNLGNVRHTCLGNISKCRNGLSITLWLKPHNAGTEIYYMTNGGQTKDAIGIHLLQKNLGFSISFRNESGYWNIQNVQFELLHWYHITMVFIPNTAARLFLNGCLAKEQHAFTQIRSNRVGTYNDLILGDTNKPSHQNGGYQSEMTIDELMMWDAVMDEHKVWDIFMSYE